MRSRPSWSTRLSPSTLGAGARPATTPTWRRSRARSWWRGPAGGAGGDGPRRCRSRSAAWPSSPAWSTRRSRICSTERPPSGPGPRRGPSSWTTATRTTRWGASRPSRDAASGRGLEPVPEPGPAPRRGRRRRPLGMAGPAGRRPRGPLRRLALADRSPQNHRGLARIDEAVSLVEPAVVAEPRSPWRRDCAAAGRHRPPDEPELLHPHPARVRVEPLEGHQLRERDPLVASGARERCPGSGREAQRGCRRCRRREAASPRARPDHTSASDQARDAPPPAPRVEPGAREQVGRLDAGQPSGIHDGQDLGVRPRAQLPAASGEYRHAIPPPGNAPTRRRARPMLTDRGRAWCPTGRRRAAGPDPPPSPARACA